MVIKGKVFVFGDHVNTDEIIPARYLSTSNPAELAKFCMEDIRPGFGKRDDIRGSILVAGENFGCGSSREHAPIAIQASGIQCVIAKSFARIFLRNSINIGLPLVTIPQPLGFVDGREVEVDFGSGVLCDPGMDMRYSFEPYPQFMQDIFKNGGWLEYARNVLLQDKQTPRRSVEA